MSRQVGDERARYGRKSVRERLDDFLGWPPAHPVATAVILLFLVVGTLFFGSQGLSASPESLRAGDCLFVRTAASQEEVRPIGAPAAVTASLLAGGAERTDCGASHGHEVVAAVMAGLPSGEPGASGSVLTRADVAALAGPTCDGLFEGYVGHPLAGSRYVTFAVFPDDPAAWVASGRRVICLVARADGAWMDHPARGSRE